MAISKLNFHFGNRGNHKDGDKYIADTTLNAMTAKTDEIIDYLNKLEVEDFQNQVTFNETPGGYIQFKKIGNIIIINYQGAVKAHQGEDLLFVIPKKYAPQKNDIIFPFVKYASAYGQAKITIEGKAQVNIISSTSASGRIVFNVVYTI